MDSTGPSGRHQETARVLHKIVNQEGDCYGSNPVVAPSNFPQEASQAEQRTLPIDQEG